MSESTHEVTLLLGKIRSGDNSSQSRLFQLVEVELRRIANSYMRQERPDHTLQATILADEAFLRLAGCARTDWRDRAHFFCAAARAMRRILVDHERQRRAQKRGGGQQQRVLEDGDVGREYFQEDLLALDEALEKLTQLDPRQIEIVNLHHFGGFTIEETAQIMNVSRSTVKRELAAARAWLHMELSDAEDDA